MGGEMQHNKKETVTPKSGEAQPGKQNFDIQQTPGALQAAAMGGMSPLSLMDAQKPMAQDEPLLSRMYPSSTRA